MGSLVVLGMVLGGVGNMGRRTCFVELLDPSGLRTGASEMNLAVLLCCYYGSSHVLPHALTVSHSGVSVAPVADPAPKRKAKAAANTGKAEAEPKSVRKEKEEQQQGKRTLCEAGAIRAAQNVEASVRDGITCSCVPHTSHSECS